MSYYEIRRTSCFLRAVLLLIFLLLSWLYPHKATTVSYFMTMERELRLKAFIEEYARVVQLFDDIVAMKESMGRLETYMVIMVCQMGGAMIAVSLFLLLRFCQAQRHSGEYQLEHRFERNPVVPLEKKIPP